MQRALLICFAICGIAIGTYVSHACIIYVQDTNTFLYPPLTAPQVTFQYGTVISVDAANRVVALQIIDPFAPSQNIRMDLTYDDKTFVRGLEGKIFSDGPSGAFTAGTRVLVGISRREGVLYTGRILAVENV